MKEAGSTDRYYVVKATPCRWLKGPTCKPNDPHLRCSSSCLDIGLTLNAGTAVEVEREDVWRIADPDDPTNGEGDWSTAWVEIAKCEEAG
jgi:hypothetical protein